VIFVSLAVTTLLFVAAPAAGSQSFNPCSVIAKEDIAAVAGADAKGSAVGDEQCNIEGATASYEVHVIRANAAQQMKDWQMLAMAKPVAAVPGIGDEAFADKTGTMVVARKGSVAIQVTPAGVSPKAPMPAKQGVVELAKRIAAKLK
jgi:hypothetical protein